MIAALYVDPRGPYAGIKDVDVWDEARDARLYRGPHPVVAHPPCGRWCRLAGLIESRYGLRRGEDGGCFEHALRCVRTYGGVLEHPAFSDAFKAFDLPIPKAGSSWQRGLCGGFVLHVEQGHYGHPARKATWLYAFSARALPLLRTDKSSATALVSWCNNRGQDDRGKRVRVGKKYASKTPPEFRDILLSIARSVTR